MDDTTRGRILVLLCRDSSTVTDLAARLGVTENAVRAQLERLMRDGLVRHGGSRRGVRRPHAEYMLTSKARELFPKAYEPALRTLVEVIDERLPKRAARDLLLQTGRRLMSAHLGQVRGRNPRERLARMIAALNGSSLGVEVVDEAGRSVVRSCSCPLASVVSTHPEICDVLASVLGDVLGARVRQRCERGESPRCCFEVAHGTTHGRRTA